MLVTDFQNCFHCLQIEQSLETIVQAAVSPVTISVFVPVLNLTPEAVTGKVPSPWWSDFKPYTTKPETGLIVCGIHERAIRYTLITVIVVHVTITEGIYTKNKYLCILQFCRLVASGLIACDSFGLWVSLILLCCKSLTGICPLI